MKAYRIEDDAVIALARMMTDEDVEEEFRVAEETGKGIFDQTLVLRMAKLLGREAAKMRMTRAQFGDHLEAEAAVMLDEDPDHLRKIAAILRLERAS